MFDIIESFTQFCGGEAKAPTPPEKSTAAAGADPKKEVVKEEADNSTEKTKSICGPMVDPMNASNYLVVLLTRPMGILFEENLDDVHLYGGAVIADVKDGCSAAVDGSIRRGDQLVAIGTKRVSGMDFDEIMKIIEGSGRMIKLTVFRGTAESLYGPWASVDWLDAFVAERGEVAALYDAQVDSFALPDDTADFAASKDDSPAISAVDEDAFGAVKADLFGAGTTAVLDAIDEENKADAMLGLGVAEVSRPIALEELEVLVVGNDGEADERNDVDAGAVLGVDTKEDDLEEADAVEEVLAIDEAVESTVEESLEKEADAVDNVLADDEGVESKAEDGVEEDADTVEDVLAIDEAVDIKEDVTEEETEAAKEILVTDEGAKSTVEESLEKEADAVEDVLAIDERVDTKEDGVEEEADAVEEVLATDEATDSVVEYGVEAESVEDVLETDEGVDAKEDGVVEEAEVLTIDEAVESTVEDCVEEEADAVENVLTIDEVVESAVEEADVGPAGNTESFEEKKEGVDTNGADAVVVENDASANGDFPTEATALSSDIMQMLTSQMGLEKLEASPAPAPIDITDSFDKKKNEDDDEANVIEDVASDDTPEAETPLLDLLDFHDANENPLPIEPATNPSKIEDLLDHPALVSDDEQDDLMSFN